MSSPEEFSQWNGQIQSDPRPQCRLQFILAGYGVSAGLASQLVAEALQEARTRAVQQFREDPACFTSYQHYCNWVTRVARNCAADMLRRPRDNPLESDDDLVPLVEPHGHQLTWEVAHEALGAILGSFECVTVPSELEHLQLLDWAILKWHHADDLTLEEIADRVLQPGGTVNARRLRIFRHLRWLWQELQRWLQNAGLL